MVFISVARKVVATPAKKGIPIELLRENLSPLYPEMPFQEDSIQKSIQALVSRSFAALGPSRRLMLRASLGRIMFALPPKLERFKFCAVTPAVVPPFYKAFVCPWVDFLSQESISKLQQNMKFDDRWRQGKSVAVLR